MTRVGLLTLQQIVNAKAEAGDIWLTDCEIVRGIGRLTVRISPSGTKRFYYRYSIGGSRRAVPLGPFTATPRPGWITLEQARCLAQKCTEAYQAAADVAAAKDNRSLRIKPK